MYFSDSCDDKSVSFGEQTDSKKKSWALSATATTGRNPTPFPIRSSGSRIDCPLNRRNLVVSSKGEAQLSGSTASFKIIPKNASTDCNTVYLQIQGGSKNGQYLSYGDCTSKKGFTYSKIRTSSTAMLWKLAPSGPLNYPLLENHAQDNKVRKSYMANVAEFACTPSNSSISPFTLTFTRGIVYAGADNTNSLISFICPQLNQTLPGGAGLMDLEVNIGTVGGAINPKSGAALFLLGDVSWMIWGQFTLPGIPPFNLTKANAAQVGILNPQGEDVLYIDNVAKNATNVAAVGVEAYTALPYGNQTIQQQAVLALVNGFIAPGLLDKGTKLQWNIYLEAFTVPEGSEYVDIAHDHDM